MSQNNIPNNLPGVEKLIQRVVAAKRSQQREIRITIQEAEELTQELAILTSKLGKTVTEIHEMLLELRGSQSEIEVKFDGGTF